MSRIALTDGTGRYFDPSKAQKWDEETTWDGRNHVSKATGSQFDHEALYRTVGGVYVLHHWSQWQGRLPRYEEITAAEAAVWLSRNDYIEGDAEQAGPDVSQAYSALEIP